MRKFTRKRKSYGRPKSRRRFARRSRSRRAVRGPVRRGGIRTKRMHTRFSKRKRKFVTAVVKQAAPDYFASKYTFKTQSAQRNADSFPTGTYGGYCGYAVIAQNHLPADYSYFEATGSVGFTGTMFNTGGFGYQPNNTNVYASCHSEAWVTNVTNSDINCCMYQCIPRRTVESGEAGIWATPLSQTYINSQTGAAGIGPQGFIDAAIDNASTTVAYDAFWCDPVYTPFQNPRFCQYFKISKCVDFTIAAGRAKHVVLTSPKLRRWRPGPDNTNDISWRGAPFLLLKFWGIPAASNSGTPSIQGDPRSYPIQGTSAPVYTITPTFAYAELAVCGWRKYEVRTIQDRSTTIRPGYGSFASTYTDLQVMSRPAAVPTTIGAVGN